MIPCRICNGSKHIINARGEAERCKCIAGSLRVIRYKEAGVPEAYRHGENPKWMHAKQVVEFSNLIPSPGEPRRKIVWVRLPVTSVLRHAVVAYALRVYADAGLEACRYSMPELIQAQFDTVAVATAKQRIREAACFVLDAECESGHKFGPQVISELWGIRSSMRALTIVACADDIASMPVRYGAHVARAFELRTGITEFKWSVNERSK